MRTITILVSYWLKVLDGKYKFNNIMVRHQVQEVIRTELPTRLCMIRRDTCLCMYIAYAHVSSFFYLNLVFCVYDLSPQVDSKLKSYTVPVYILTSDLMQCFVQCKHEINTCWLTYLVLRIFRGHFPPKVNRLRETLKTGKQTRKQ